MFHSNMSKKERNIDLKQWLDGLALMLYSNPILARSNNNNILQCSNVPETMQSKHSILIVDPEMWNRELRPVAYCFKSRMLHHLPLSLTDILMLNSSQKKAATRTNTIMTCIKPWYVLLYCSILKYHILQVQSIKFSNNKMIVLFIQIYYI